MRLSSLTPLLSIVTLSLLLLGTPGASWAGIASAGTLLIPAGALAMTAPDPPDWTVIPCDALNGVLLAPEGLAANQVEITVRNLSGDPVPNATVKVEFAPALSLCSGTVLTAVTDTQGQAFFTLTGGGCRTEPASCVIKVNNQTGRSYENVKSPDFDGSGADLNVNLSDLIDFSNQFLGSAPADCHDYDNNGSTDLSDLVIFSAAFTMGQHCP